MVVSGSPLASEVGRDILRHGGNAVDAAVAVGFALAVVHPEAGNIGGGGFMVIRLRDGEVQRARLPRDGAGARHPRHVSRLRGRADRASVTGHLAAGVPGAVAGLTEAHRRYGRLPFARRDRAGDPAGARRIRRRRVPQPRRSRSDSARLVALPRLARDLPARTAQPPRAGIDACGSPTWRARWRRSGTAGPPASTRPGRRPHRGRDGARRRADHHEDLAAYQAIWREPIDDHLSRAHDLLDAARLVGRRDDGRDPQHHGRLRPAAAVRHPPPCCIARPRRCGARSPTATRYLGDPGFVQIPLERLLSKEYAAELRAADRRAAPRPRPRSSPALAGGASTTHYSVVDAEGNAVSCTTTLNNSYGSAVTVTGAGFLLNDEMDDFATAPGKPNMYGLVQGEANAIAPGKRMLSAMTPSIVLDRDRQLLLMVRARRAARASSRWSIT